MYVDAAATAAATASDGSAPSASAPASDAGEAVASTARVAALGRRRHHQRGAVALHEERATGAERDHDAARLPPPGEQLAPAR